MEEKGKMDVSNKADAVNCAGKPLKACVDCGDMPQTVNSDVQPEIKSVNGGQTPKIV